MISDEDKAFINVELPGFVWRHRVLTTKDKWAPAEDKILGTMSDVKAAKEIGCSNALAKRRRLFLGIEAAQSRYTWPEKEQLHDMCQTMSMKEIADSLGRKRDTTAWKLKSLGLIPRSQTFKWEDHDLASLSRTMSAEQIKDEIGAPSAALVRQALYTRGLRAFFVPKAKANDHLTSDVLSRVILKSSSWQEAASLLKKEGVDDRSQHLLATELRRKASELGIDSHHFKRAPTTYEQELHIDRELMRLSSTTTVSALSRHLEISDHRILSRMKDLGLSAYKATVDWDDPEVQALAKTLSFAQIDRHFGLSAGCASTMLGKRGVDANRSAGLAATLAAKQVTPVVATVNGEDMYFPDVMSCVAGLGLSSYKPVYAVLSGKKKTYKGVTFRKANS